MRQRREFSHGVHMAFLVTLVLVIFPAIVFACVIIGWYAFVWLCGFLADAAALLGGLV